MDVEAHLPILCYRDDMGRVDRIDKDIALSRIRLKRCLRRYHRAIFLWYMASMYCNEVVLFDLIFDTADLRKAKANVGYKHYYQNQLGNVLILRGIRIAENDKMNYNATIVIRFMCRTGALRLLRTKRYRWQTQFEMALVRQRQRRQRRQSALRDRTNNQPARGRPKKRKRGGGRRPLVTPITPPLVTNNTNPDTPTGPTGPVAVSPERVRFARYLRRRGKYVLPPFDQLSAVVQQRLSTLSFVNRTPAFVPKRRGPKRKGKKTVDGLQVGGVTHRLVPTKDLQSRRGRRVATPCRVEVNMCELLL